MVECDLAKVEVASSNLVSRFRTRSSVEQERCPAEAKVARSSRAGFILPDGEMASHLTLDQVF